jgi:hypothetical protein
MQLSIDKYNEIYGTDLKELTPVEFSDYITFLMKQVELPTTNNDDFLSDIKNIH